MAKKKKKKRRPGGPARPGSAGPARPAAEQAAGAEAREQRRTAAKERREAQFRARHAARRRKQARNIGIVVVVVGAIVAFAVFRTVQGGKVAKEADKLAAAAGCGKVESFDVGGAGDHLKAGEAVKYEQSPPVGGRHAGSTINAGLHTEPFSEDPNAGRSIYQAVHSLEHGYVIVWHKDLSEQEVGAIESAFGKERKVIIAPYPTLVGGKMALTSWGQSQTCKTPDVKLIRSFVKRFRESSKAPEPKAA